MICVCKLNKIIYKLAIMARNKFDVVIGLLNSKNIVIINIENFYILFCINSFFVEFMFSTVKNLDTIATHVMSEAELQDCT